jgi:hypothetical protein
MAESHLLYIDATADNQRNIPLGDDLHDEADDTSADWFDRRALIWGGKIERRRTDPLAGWYIIGDYGAIGPFHTAWMAKAWSEHHSTRRRINPA